MHPLIEELDNEQQAFVIGTSFHIQFYETDDGSRFARQRDGSYSAGGKSCASFPDLLVETLGPVTPGQLYALTAIYHPLVTSRISPDHDPNRMSRSEARAFVVNEFTDITPFDVTLEAGTLHFKAKAERHALHHQPARQSAPSIALAPPPPRVVTATIELSYVVDESVSDEALLRRVEEDAASLATGSSGGKISLATAVVATMSAAKEALKPA